MGEGYLRPTKVDTANLGKRRMADGIFQNPPTYSELGGFTSADKLKMSQNKMTLERSGPTALKGRPIS